MSHQAEYQTSCLERVIALQGGCDPVVPTSGLYGSSIGITKEFIESVITKGYSSALSFWNEKKNFAIDNIVNSIHSAFQNKYKVTSLVKNYRVGHVNDNKVAVAGNTGMKGIYYDLCNSNSYLDLFVNEISIFTDYSGDIDINVYDLLQNKIIDTIVITSVAGQISTVYPAKRYKSNFKQLSLFFAYDSTGVNSYKTTLTKGCTDCSGINYISGSYQNIRAGYIASASDKIVQNFNSLSETGGLSINHSLLCNHSDWLCSLSGLIALPVLYKTGAIICEYALDESPSTRVNTNTILNRDAIKERLSRYEFKYRESLDNILNSVNVPNDSVCFNCKANAIYQTFSI